jgi:hypothetical protein
VSVPEHLSDAPLRQVFTEGYWCSDISFESEGPGPRLMNENRWVLPRRWRMANAFRLSTVGETRHVVPPSPRRNRQGNLTVFVNAEHPVDTIRVPSPEEAIRHAFVVDGSHVLPNSEDGEAFPTSKVAWIGPSNEARYLTGVLGMAGGLQNARRFLLHPFLQTTFAKLGGAPNVPTHNVTPTVNRLTKRARLEAVFSLTDEADREALADLIVKAARSLKSPRAFISYDELKKGWREYREAYWKQRPEQARDSSPEVDWNKREDDSLDDCLVEMRQRQLLFQGHQWTCTKCHHRNWVDLTALSSKFHCDVCHHPTLAPANIRWLFRANEFLVDSLRDHSALSLSWVLSALCDRARSSLLFVGPTWFKYSHDSRGPDAEADLLVVLDGKAMVCEVKSSWSGLRPPHIDDFISLARRLRPDVALLAVMEKGRGPVADLTKTHAQLVAEGIEFELLTLDAYAPEDEPYLHH